MGKLFTSESVTEGHPDKIADQISDAILDALLEQDPYSRVAAETTVATGIALVVGEITTNAYVDIAKIARETIKEIGYVNNVDGYNANSIAVLTSIDEQSADIALGVDKAYESKQDGVTEDFGTGAGDQGIIFGYATDETPEYLPPAISFAHRLTRQLTKVRKDGTLPYLRPDGKSQVTVEFEEDGKTVKRIHTIVISTQHAEEVTLEQIRKDILTYVIKPVIPEELLDEDTIYYVNPTGRFVIGGPQGDSGLTGRKIIVDTYGGTGRHGGGAFSGKDPTKVDRSAAYAARWVAKNLVAAGVAKRLEVELAYAIGVAKPVSIAVETFGTATITEEKIVEIIEKVFDLRPAAIIDALNLRRPIYKQTAAYGHFGRTDIDLPWEHLDKVEEIKKYL
ncbi:MAG: methionine adenosyltransferase [Roseburia sp.]|uniref:methionine adenosyltransferase n=1 Tax=Roseburia sp. 831b TaxID=1261635 RepID=UPI0009523606|nr:methionine adenosyltransferase [Roseburia sp. 831b]MCI5919938.1 methionine adenosyltransferase [Roseburia sp.]MDD6216323.1 methionine adenosyltransferase [Roseburia sp.]MDY5882622.1 methionine adenosyltransferase [Roseburia sp.]WVK73305.1 methionine adenosyltransferase [Roseburia sp. 831b]